MRKAALCFAVLLALGTLVGCSALPREVSEKACEVHNFIFQCDGECE